jgi:hypothetical protein
VFPHPTRLLALVALVAATLTVLAAGAFTGQAQAVQLSHAVDRPGSITAEQAYGWIANTCGNTGRYCPEPRLTIPGPLVSRANNGNADQRLDATYRIYKYVDGDWQRVGVVTRSFNIDQQILLPDFTWNTGSTGYFTVDIRFEWNLRSTGTFLSARTANWNGDNAHDYRCYGARCSAARGWVHLS